MIVGPDAAQTARLNGYLAQSKLPTARLRVTLKLGGCGEHLACAGPWDASIAWPDPDVVLDPVWERIMLYHELAHIRDMRHEHRTRYRLSFVRILRRGGLLARDGQWRMRGNLVPGAELLAVAVSLCSLDRERLDEGLRVYAGGDHVGYRPTPVQHWRVCRLLSAPWS